VTDLTDEQKAALIEALDRGSDVYAFGDECQMATLIPPHSGIWVSGPGSGPTDATVRLTPAGRLLAQAYKRERELEMKRDRVLTRARAEIAGHEDGEKYGTNLPDDHLAARIARRVVRELE
jgi:hypothetical protein